LLEVKDLEISVGSFCVSNLNFSVSKGEYAVIVGDSGCGKTLLLETIAGIYFPIKGKIFWEGRDVTLLPPERRNFSLLYQDFSLFPHLNVKENILLGRIEDGRPLKEVTDKLSITHLLGRFPGSLSRGEAQRVALARAIIRKSPLLLLDEPFSSLPPTMRRKLGEEIKRISREEGITVLHVTHDVEEAFLLGDTLIFMERKKGILGKGTPEEIIHKPFSPKIPEILGGKNIFVGEVRGKEELKEFCSSRVKFQLITPYEGKGIVVIDPGDIILSLTPVNTSARNVMEGRVIRMINKGSVREVEVEAGEKFRVVITSASSEELGIREGKKIFLIFKASCVHFLPLNER